MKHLLILPLLIVTFSVHAQKQGKARLDSLLQALPTAREDANRVDLLLSIAIEQKAIDPAQALAAAQQGLKLSKKLRLHLGEAVAQNTLGNVHKAKSDYPNALAAYQAALNIYEEVGAKKEQGIALMNIGTVYRPLKEYDKALDYYVRALHVSEEVGNEQLVAQLHGNIGVVYFSKEDWATSLQYSQKALRLFQALEDSINIAWTLGNSGDAHAKMGAFDTAMKLQHQAIAIYETLGNKAYKASGLDAIASYYLDMAEKEPAPIAREHITEAIRHYRQSIPLYEELGDLDYLKDAHFQLAGALEQLGKHEEALSEFRKYEAVKDSVQSVAVSSKVGELETERAIAVKDREIQIETLKKRADRLILGSGIALMLVVAGFAVYGYRRERSNNLLLSAEKQKSEDLLLNILPAEIAEELKGKGSASAQYYEEATVLFTDFVNFTEAAQTMSPHELVGELHDCFKAFDEIVSRYGIEKIKTVGDAYLAVSGLPAKDHRHAYNIVSAAMEISCFMKERLRSLGGQTFEVRIGIHTGPVVAGIVGVKKFAYDIWGDTVNTAARMEQTSEPGRINVSQTTYELVKREFPCIFRGELEAKHKGKLAMYFIANEEPTHSGKNEVVAAVYRVKH